MQYHLLCIRQSSMIRFSGELDCLVNVNINYTVTLKEETSGSLCTPLHIEHRTLYVVVIYHPQQWPNVKWITHSIAFSSSYLQFQWCNVHRSVFHTGQLFTSIQWSPSQRGVCQSRGGAREFNYYWNTSSRFQIFGVSMLHLQGGGAGQLVTPMLRQRLCKYYIITHGKSNLTSFTKLLL